MINEQDYTGTSSFWQVMEGRKRRYQVLEQNDFNANNANVDYDTIFNQIDKELGDDCSSQS